LIPLLILVTIKKSLEIDYSRSKTTGYSANFILTWRSKQGFYYFTSPQPSPIKERGIRKSCGKTTGNLKLKFIRSPVCTPTSRKEMPPVLVLPYATLSFGSSSSLCNAFLCVLCVFA
jgi:hypothetical protein